MSEDFQIKTLEVQLQSLLSKVNILIQKTGTQDYPEWINLRLASELKGGAAYETYRTRFWLQPCAGTNYQKIAGKKAWKKSDVIQWLSITDQDLAEYAKAFGVKIP